MNFTGVDALLAQAMDNGVFPGVTAIVTGPDGTRHECMLGTDERTMFRIASMTKALASVGAMQLVEQGRLDLDQSVASVLPEFRELMVLDGFEGDEPRLRPPAKQATIRHLLTHTSGLSYAFNNAELARCSEVMGLPHLLTGTRASLNAPLVCDPGTKWEYGVSTDWLGLVIEAISGQALGEFLRDGVFAPLGMEDTTFRPTDEQRARTMDIRDRQADGTLAPSEIGLPDDPELDFGGSGAYGTARDYERFLRAMLRGGELDGARILKRETVDLMLSDHLRGAPLPELIKSADLRLTNDIPSLPFRQGWGLGFHLVLEDIPGMRPAGTGDWAGLFNCFYWLDRKSGVAGILMTQILPFFDPRVIETLLGFEGTVYSQVAATATA